MVTLPIYPGTRPAVPVSMQPIPAVKGVRRDTGAPDVFQRELDSRLQPRGLTFSRHAQKRLEMRGIVFTPQGLKRIEQAVDRVQDKGSRDALVLAGELALVVSVPNRTVVTVMSRENMEESVVTNIDSAVFA